MSQILWVRSSGARLLPAHGPGLQPCKGQTRAGGPAARRAYSHGCWQEASLIHFENLSMGYSSPHLTVATSASESDLRAREGSHSVFIDLISEVTDCVFHQIPFIRSESRSAQEWVRLLLWKGGEEFKYFVDVF